MPDIADISRIPVTPDQEPEGIDQEELNLGSFPIDSLMIRTETRSVFEVSRRIDNGLYIMDPDFQRDFIWDVDRQSKLIESSVLRIPLPVFYLAEALSGNVVVVDGLQRLTTFHNFLKNKLTLKNLAFAKELNGSRFRDLAPALQNRIEDTPLTLYLIDSSVPEEAKYEIFERVNGGVPLTRQQMRNCLFVGDATRWLGKMSKQPEFLDATGRSLNWKTMRDRECVNRFAGFYTRGWPSYEGKMEAFLNDTLQRLNRDGNFEHLSEVFLRSMKSNHFLFGRHAFRKSLLLPNARSVINIALFDILSVAFASWSEDSVRAQRSQIVSSVKELLSDPAFDQSISHSTNSARNVHLRFSALTEKLQVCVPQ